MNGASEHGPSEHGPSEHNGHRPSAGLRELRAQIAQDRRALTETISELQAKTDVKARAREKITDAEIAASDLTSRVGRAATAAVDVTRSAGTTVAGRVRDRVPRPVVAQAERVGGFLRREARFVVGGAAAVLAGAVVMVRRHTGRNKRRC